MTQNTNDEEKNAAETLDKSSTGLERNVAGALCYALGFLSGIVFLLIEKDSKFVRYHAFQSIFIWGVYFVLGFILMAIPIIGWAISILLAPVGLIIWIICMVQAYQGKQFKFPVAGDIAEKQVNNT